MAGPGTLKNIAERAGLSVPTVSQILNNRKNYCSEATKERVREIAREIGYRPNFAYRLMQGQKTKTAAIFNSMPQMNSEEYVMKLIMRLISGFDKLGYSAYCHAFSSDPAANLEKVRTLINRKEEHFVFLGCPYGHEAILAELKKYKLPVIGNSPVYDRWVYKGVIPGIQAIYRYLDAETGGNYKLICQKKEASEGNEKIKALKMIYPDRNLDEIIREKIFFSENIDFEIDDYAEAAYPVGAEAAYPVGAEATARLLREHPGIGGIAYMNDNFAVGGAGCILQPGNEKFRRILLAGCNNEHVVHNFPLPISSVGYNLNDMAELLVSHALTSEPCRITVLPLVCIRKANSGNTYPPWNETIIELNQGEPQA